MQGLIPSCHCTSRITTGTISRPLGIQPCMENACQFNRKAQCKIRGLGEGESTGKGPSKVQGTHSCVFDNELYGYFNEISKGS